MEDVIPPQLKRFRSSGVDVSRLTECTVFEAPDPVVLLSLWSRDFGY